jgi:hypothetical protein
MKTVACFVAISSVLIPFTCGAQTPVAAQVASVPSAKILAIGRFNARPTPEQLQILSLRWYATGKIDQWFSPQDGNGVLLILNLSSVDEAHAMLDSGPPGQPQLLTFELIPVDPLVPLTRLLPHPAKPAK